MKIAALFAKFLYQQRELKLPGIGVFTLDPSVIIPESTEKNYYDFTQQIKFTQIPVAHADDEFINFIRTETGKIKPLAESDLDSFLSDGKILLNIGKPFHFEGIGYLQKNRAGVFEFTPGDASLPRPPQAQTHETAEQTPKNRTYYSDEAAPGGGSRKILIGLAVIAGIAIIVWLGYILYSRSSKSNRIAEQSLPGTAVKDSAASTIPIDSAQFKMDSDSNAQAAGPAAPLGSYKFIIEKTHKARAYRRYNQIRETLTDIRMETKDSTLFSLYFILPAKPSDTARISDSLKIWYGRKRVWVE